MTTNTSNPSGIDPAIREKIARVKRWIALDVPRPENTGDRERLKRDLTELLAIIPSDGWQDISTAPKDGTRILACSVNHDACEVVCWQDGADSTLDEDQAGWVNDGPIKDRFYANPRWFTHWRPVDPPPSEHTNPKSEGGDA